MNTKKIWQTFLKPGWVITAVLIILFSYFAITVLAPWQLGKHEVKSAQNTQVRTALRTDPVSLGEVFTQTGDLPEDKQWRQVTATGHYLPEKEVILRLRSINGNPVFQVLTVFTTDDGHSVLVNRGYVPQQKNSGVPQIPAAPTDTVTITGNALPGEPDSGRQPTSDENHQYVLDINLPQISSLTDADLASGYVQLAKDQPGVLQPIPLPKLDGGPYLSYGLQWIAMGVGAPLALLYFIRMELKERRRDEREREEIEALEVSYAAPSTAAGSEPAPGERAGSATATAGQDALSSDGAEKTAATAPAAASDEEPQRPTAPTRSRYGGSRRNPYTKFEARRQDRF
ncbi:SURF1 family protein [Corynebacterium pyruviciproducens]|uniref:SURF1-like protein n=1 Tax=Corynebacterium pyruviciproducens TaxID=598660 RepID=A0AAF0YXB1_9CORY|nr:SURF1 family protein [Corynebacterium pyruviciproducens]WOT02888.1 SURF1 family protein [Corynebacterium pyruviciproducens]